MEGLKTGSAVSCYDGEDPRVSQPKSTHLHREN